MNYVLIGLIFFLSACGKLNYSPYVIDPANTNANQVNLDKILSLGASARGAESGEVNFKFAVLSDTHDYYDGLEKQINYINAHKNEYDFVIVTGDLTNVGMQDEYDQTKKRLDKLAVPYLTTIGNHDLLIDGGIIYQYVFGNHTYAFEYKNSKFILFNNNNWESSNNVPDINWVENQLAQNSQQENSRQNVFLLSHVAPDDHDRFTDAQIKNWEEMVNRHGVKYYINGHNHNPADGKFGNATQVTAGSSAKNVLLEVSIANDEVSHGFIYL